MVPRVILIQKKSLKPKSITAKDTQNTENHLWEAYQISDPSGKRMTDK